MIHIYAHVFRIISNLTFGFVLLNSVTGVQHPKEIMIAAIKSKIKYPTSNAPFGSAYEEHAAIKDTAAEVRALRKNGIHVSAVFMGNDGEVTNAKQIYGKEFTRIRQIDQLSKAAGRLIQKEIRELYS